MRLERALQRLHRSCVHRAAQVGVIPVTASPNCCASRPATRALSSLPSLSFKHELCESIVVKRHQDGGEIAEELVKRRRFRADRLVIMRPQTVEHGVAEFMIDDVATTGR